MYKHLYRENAPTEHKPGLIEIDVILKICCKHDVSVIRLRLFQSEILVETVING